MRVPLSDPIVWAIPAFSVLLLVVYVETHGTPSEPIQGVVTESFHAISRYSSTTVRVTARLTDGAVVSVSTPSRLPVGMHVNCTRFRGRLTGLTYHQC